MFEAIHSETTSATPAAVWALWSDPGRWGEWNEQVEHAEAGGDLAPGCEVTVKLRRGGKIRYAVTALEPERVLIQEAGLPGAKLGHEHRLDRSRGETRINHRIYVRGPLWPIFALLLGRKRMRKAVIDFAERERELVE